MHESEYGSIHPEEINEIKSPRITDETEFAIAKCESWTFDPNKKQRSETTESGAVSSIRSQELRAS